jgi:hypothetical protein
VTQFGDRCVKFATHQRRQNLLYRQWDHSNKAGQNIMPCSTREAIVHGYYPARLSLLITAIGSVYLNEPTAVFAQRDEASEDFEKCRVIASDQLRLNCLKGLLPQASSDPRAFSLHDSWQFVRIPGRAGGPDAVSIARIADTSQSDPDLAGLMIRCEEKNGLEVLLALVRPFPSRAKRDVAIAWGTTQSVFQAQASPIGTTLILPIEAAAFAKGAWQGLKELAVTIKDPDAEIRGVIPLDGLAPAMAKLSASCPK